MAKITIYIDQTPVTLHIPCESRFKVCQNALEEAVNNLLIFINSTSTDIKEFSIAAFLDPGFWEYLANQLDQHVCSHTVWLIFQPESLNWFIYQDRELKERVRNLKRASKKFNWKAY